MGCSGSGVPLYRTHGFGGVQDICVTRRGKAFLKQGCYVLAMSDRMTLSELVDLDVDYAAFNALKTISDVRESEFRDLRVGGVAVTRDDCRGPGYYNRIVLREAISAGALDQAMEVLEGCQCIRVDMPGELSGVMASMLAERGFAQSSRLLWLESVEDVGPSTVEVRRLADAEVDLLAPLLGIDDVHAPLWRSRSVHLATEQFRVFVVEADGEIVAMATSYIRGRNVLLGNAETRPQFRRRGFHAALVQVRVRDAREAGAMHVVTDVEPDSASHRNCLRLGFEARCEMQVWEREASSGT